MKAGEPEPSGRRSSPPPKLRTALAAEASPCERVVILHLLDQEEEDVLVRAFGVLGWRVVASGDLLDIVAAIEERPQIVLTDDPSLAKSLPEIWDVTNPSVVVLVDDRNTAVQGALDAGADWVITRPVDPEDPLGFGLL